MTGANGQHAGTWPLLKWVWSEFMRPHLWWVLLAMLLMSVEGSMLGLLSYMVQPMFDRIFAAAEAGAIWWIGAAVFGIFLTRAVTSVLHRTIMTMVGQRTVADIQLRMVGHVLTLDGDFFQANPPGNLIERVRGDSNAVQQVWQHIVSAAGRDLVALVSLVAVALSIDVVWTLVAVIGVPLLVLPIAALQRAVRHHSARARETSAEVSTRLDEIFHGIAALKLNRAERAELARFGAMVRRFVRDNIRATAAVVAVPAVLDIVAGIGFFGVLVLGGQQIVSGEKTVGEFMSFFTAMALVFEPLRRLGYVSGAWQSAAASLDRLQRVLSARATITDPARPVSPPVGLPDIVFDRVTLAYDDLQVLDRLSFTAPAGKVTALVGASGAGKTTTFNVLARLVDPQDGRVTVGGIDTRQMRLADLRGLISIVSQEAALFDESIRDNILMGRPGASEQELLAAAKAAFVMDFAQSLPLGLDTPVGPRGSALSGGQRQRVAIARALLRDTPILLLDEPTSALDSRSEEQVQKALDRLSRNRTTLVIAHRLSTIRDADKIVVMDRGRAVDEGTHEELLQRDGLYAGLYNLQFRGT